MTVTSEQRGRIRELANNCCEYYRVGQDDRLSRFQIDHIIPVKHNGTDDIENLCLACLKCNGFMIPNVAALDPDSGEATRLYNPRKQLWDTHFSINPDATLIGHYTGRPGDNPGLAHQ